ncbi:MAG TPA: hypothetical protein VFL82_02475 [Thermomicrobiales bacterium]|nr:hypothetical protein [Thermomicrobiales bacterium]
MGQRHRVHALHRRREWFVMGDKTPDQRPIVWLVQQSVAEGLKTLRDRRTLPLGPAAASRSRDYHATGAVHHGPIIAASLISADRTKRRERSENGNRHSRVLVNPRHRLGQQVGVNVAYG